MKGRAEPVAVKSLDTLVPSNPPDPTPLGCEITNLVLRPGLFPLHMAF